jgi:hypothetical protein
MAEQKTQGTGLVNMVDSEWLPVIPACAEP